MSQGTSPSATFHDLFQFLQPRLLTNQFNQLCTQAAEDGKFEILQGLRAIDPPCPWDATTFESASSHGHLPILQWLKDHDCPWDATTFARAARRGHMGLLPWLKQHGCPWDEDTCVAAAQGGHLSVLQWLRQHGCPWDATETCLGAARSGHIDVLAWVRAQDPCAPWPQAIMARAFHWLGADGFPVLQWLVAHDCPWDTHVCKDAAYICDWHAVKWCAERGAPFDSRSINHEFVGVNWTIWRNRHRQQEYYEARQWLQSRYNWQWGSYTKAWLQVVDLVATDVWALLLPKDLISLVQRYA